MLVRWGRCTYQDIDRINDIFDNLDRDAGGTLGVNDVRGRSTMALNTSYSVGLMMQ
jgi:hypothetical protein